MAKLKFIGEKFGGRVYELAAEKTTVGRGDFNTLTIQDSSVSQAHCEILVCGPEVIVRDLGSSNGTFVNGKRLHSQQCQLKGGQFVKFGSVEARLELDLPSSDDTAMAETAIYSHVRRMRKPMPEPHKPPAPLTTLESGSDADKVDHTIVLPHSTREREMALTPASGENRGPGKTGSRLALVLIVTALVVGIIVFAWFML